MAEEKKNWTFAQGDKILFSGESRSLFGNLSSRIWRKTVEALNPRFWKSSGKFPQSDDLGCHFIFWCFLCLVQSKSVQLSTRFLEYSMHTSADKLYGDAGFLFQQNSSPAHSVSCQMPESWFYSSRCSVFSGRNIYFVTHLSDECSRWTWMIEQTLLPNGLVTMVLPCLTGQPTLLRLTLTPQINYEEDKKHLNQK